MPGTSTTSGASESTGTSISSQGTSSTYYDREQRREQRRRIREGTHRCLEPSPAPQAPSAPSYTPSTQNQVSLGNYSQNQPTKHYPMVLAQSPSRDMYGSAPFQTTDVALGGGGNIQATAYQYQNAHYGSGGIPALVRAFVRQYNPARTSGVYVAAPMGDPQVQPQPGQQ